MIAVRQTRSGTKMRYVCSDQLKKPVSVPVGVDEDRYLAVDAVTHPASMMKVESKSSQGF
jgi:hypothetical protein